MRYPRLTLLLMHQCSLSLTESLACISGTQSEAVIHYGGRNKCLVEAINARKRLFKQFNNSPFEFWFTRRDRTTLLKVGI